MIFDRLKTFFFKPWVSLAYFFMLLMSFCYWDKPIAIYFRALDLDHRLPFLNGLTQLGSGVYSLLLLLLLALFFRYLKPNLVAEARAFFLWLAVLIPSAICDLLKGLLGRARPVLWFESEQYGFYWFKAKVSYWSMPSGHTTVIMALVLGLGIVFPKAAIPALLLGLLVAGTRVLLTYHYLSDVLLAAYLVLLELAVLLYWLRKSRNPALLARLSLILR